MNIDKQHHNSSASKMESDTVLQATGIGKKFCKNLRRSMTYGIGELAKNLVGISPNLNTLRKDEFWALQEMDLELKRGEVLGLIGPNGCGKSTLLRLLAGILPLDKGKTQSRGRVGALIALGAGFHPYMTARENIYLNGTILGMSHEEIKRKFDDIVAFSELEKFVDTPVATFSSGMRVRLGFAIAIHCEPNILLVDEVLAVGDVGFRAKCYHHITRLMEHTGIILVTHSMAHVARYCDRVMLLDHGEVKFTGSTVEGIEHYLDCFGSENGEDLISDKDNCINSFTIIDKSGEPNSNVNHGESLIIKLDCNISSETRYPNVGIIIHSREMQTIAVCRSPKEKIENKSGRIETEIKIGPMILNPGQYRLSLTVHDEAMRSHLIWSSGMWSFRVVGHEKDYGAYVVSFDGKWQTKA